MRKAKNAVVSYCAVLLTAMLFSSVSHAEYLPGYQAFIFDDVDTSLSTINGSLAVGNNAVLHGYSLKANAEGIALVAKGNIDYTAGIVESGDILAGGIIDSSINMVIKPSSSHVEGGLQTLPVDFTDTKVELTAISQLLSALTPNGSVTRSWTGIVKLNGDCQSDVQVFSLTSAQLESALGVEFNCIPDGANSYVNVSGTSLNVSLRSLIGLISKRDRILFNFYEAQNISLNLVDWYGSLLAPHAALVDGGTTYHGQLIAKSWSHSSGSVSNDTFAWLLPVHTNTPPVFVSTPVLDAQENVEYHYLVDAQDGEGDVLTYTLVSSPTGMLLTGQDLVWTPTFSQAGDHAVVLEVSDGEASSQQSFTITVANTNQPPEVTSEPATLTDEAATYTYELLATDADGQALQYTLLEGPAGMTLTDNVLSWSPSYEQAGEYTVRIGISDGETTVEQSFVLVVNNTNLPPVFTSSPILDGAENTPYLYAVSVEDADGDAVSLALIQAPAGMSLNSENQLVWIPSFEQAGSYTVTVNASDTVDVSSQSFTLTISNTNQAPIFTSTPIATGAENQAYSYTLAATDADGQTLTYSLATAPTGMTLNGDQLSWTPTYEEAGDYPVTVTVTDGEATVEQSFTLAVANTNRAPEFTSVPETAGAENQAYSYTLAATDADAQALTYALTTASTGMSLTAGQLNWTPDYEQAGDHAVTVTVTDGEATVEQSFTVTVANTNRAPEFTSVPVTAGAENQAYNYTLSATDADGQALTYALTAAPTGMSLTLDQLSWMPTYDQAGDHAVTVTVTDSETTVEQSFTLTVTNTNRLPQITSTAPTAAEEAQPYTYTLTATDADNESLTYQLTAAPQGMLLSDNVISWTPAYGQAGEQTYSVTVSDGTDSVAQTVNVTVAQGDADDDGHLDVTEQACNTDQNDPASFPVDTDADGTCNYLDSDDDGDGFPDTEELTCLSDPLQLLSVPVDTDNDTLCNALDGDDDNDGWSDSDEQSCNTDSLNSLSIPVDTDTDGTCNLIDTDDDNDGWSDQEEWDCQTEGLDSTSVPADNDSDHSCDLLDTDDDNDGVADTEDAFPFDPNESVDTDADGIGNNADTDDDNDGVADVDDAFPLDPFESADLDGDGIGDNRDPDTDGDGYMDDYDAFPRDASEFRDTDGDGIGDNTDPDIDGDGIANADDTFPEDGTETADLDGDGIGDNADTDRDGDGVDNLSDAFPLDPTRSALPVIKIDSPATLSTVGTSPVSVQGHVDQPEQVSALTVNGSPVALSGNQFTVDVSLMEGHNTIVARMVTADDIVSTASISISLDKTPPYLTIESHDEGETVHESPVLITGLINDIVRGTVEAEQASVTVNGVSADIANRSYAAAADLSVGVNTLVVQGIDQAGNINEKTITLNYQPVTGKHLTKISGDGQTATIQTPLAEPLVVEVRDASNNPMADQTVVFRVIQGSGEVAAGTDQQAQAVVLQTDATGRAATQFLLGQRAGVANHKVVARVVGFENAITFTASATAQTANKVSVNSGNNQRGISFTPLPAPFVVTVTDAGSNLIANTPIQFEVVEGGGTFSNGETTMVVNTDSDGRASALLTLGSVLGLDQQRVTATLVSSIGSDAEYYAGFTASAFEAGDPANTAISGYVLDNQDQPLPGVTVQIDGTTRKASTDTQGFFRITEAPVGPAHLLIDGSTTTAEGEYPTLSTNLVAISGVDNPLSAPVYLVKLNTDNAVMVGSEDAVITLDEVPGFKLEIPAGSATFPDGSKQGYMSVTAVNSSAIPMAPPNGMQPQFIVTIQPTGTRFDPPAPLTLPNTSAYPAGGQVEMYSFDHDLEEFVSIGLGTVSKDGATIKSNDGVGVVKAGWHCGDQPSASGTCKNDGCPDGNCDNPPEDTNQSCPLTGNPISIGTGNKFQVEVDYQGSGAMPLELVRTYNSNASPRWRTSLSSYVARELFKPSYFQHRYKNHVADGASENRIPYTMAEINRMVNEGWRPEDTKPVFYPDNCTFKAAQVTNRIVRIYMPNGSSVAFFERGELVGQYGLNPLFSFLDSIHFSLFEKAHAGCLFTHTRTEYAYTYTPLTEQAGSIERIYKPTWAYTKDVSGVITYYDENGNVVDVDHNRITWVYTDKNGNRMEFDERGRIREHSDTQGNKHAYRYYTQVNADDATKLDGVSEVSDIHGNKIAVYQIIGRADNDNGSNIRVHPGNWPYKAIVNDQLVFKYDGANSVTYPDGKTRQYRYKGRLYLTGIIDENGKRFATWDYDNWGRAISSEHANGVEQVSLKYHDKPGSNPYRVTQTNEHGKKTHYTFGFVNGSYKIKHVEGDATQSCLGAAKGYSYDAEGRLTSRTDWEGKITRFEYDARGLKTKIVKAADTADAVTVDTVWNETLPLVESRTVGGVTVLYTYDENHRVKTRTVGDSVFTYAYNSVGLVESIDGPRDDVSDITHFTYDAQGRLQTATNALGQTSTILAYNDWNLPTLVRNANGVEAELEYDARGRLTLSRRKSRDGDAETRFTLDDVGQVTAITLPDGVQIINHYDDAHRLIAIEDGAGNRIDYTLDSKGNRVKEEVKDSSGTLSYIRYRLFDELDRLLESIDASNQAEQFSYSAGGNLLTQTDANNNTSRYEYDNLHRLKASYDALDNSAQFSYDQRGNTHSVTDQRGLVTQYEYNDLDQVTKVISPDTGTTQYFYDKAGNLSYSIDANTQRSDYSYDALNRVTEVRYSDTSLNIQFSYDQNNLDAGATAETYNAGIGRITQMQSASGTQQFRYDDRSNTHTVIENRSDGVSLITRYQYDLANNLIGTTYPGNLQLDYRRNNTLGQIDQVSLTYGAADNRVTQVLASDISYQAFGPINGVTFGNGLQLSREYALDGTLASYQLSNNLQQITLDYDAAKNITAINQLQQPEQNREYSYDELHRIVAEIYGIDITSFSYDAVGNRLTKNVTETGSDPTGQTPSEQQAYDYAVNSNRLIAVDGVSYQYDSNGNLLNRGSQSWTYNARNRMASYSESGQLIASYQYNAIGERVIKQLADKTIHYRYNGAGQLTGEYHYQAGSLIKRISYIWLGSMPLAVVEQDLGSDPQGQTPLIAYLHTDHLETPRLATGVSGETLWQWQSSAFGEELPTENGLTLNLRFPGQYYDAESGLNYNYFRDYDPATGRYVQSDPIGLNGGLNTYAYVGNDPVNMIDFYGLQGSGLGSGSRSSSAPGTLWKDMDCDQRAADILRQKYIIGGFLVAGALVAAEAYLATYLSAEVLAVTTFANDGLGVAKGPIQHTKHSLNQKINRQVKSADELDAVRNPLKKTEVKYDSQGRPSEKFIGEKATVAVNPETGKVVTVHPTGSKLAERLKRQQGGGQ